MNTREFLRSKKIYVGANVADETAPENYFRLEDLLSEFAESEVKKFHKPDVIGMFMDFCQSMECEGIHNQSLGIKEGVEKYLKSINFL